MTRFLALRLSPFLALPETVTDVGGAESSFSDTIEGKTRSVPNGVAADMKGCGWRG